MALTAKQKEINEKQRKEALANKGKNVSRNKDEEAAVKQKVAKKSITMSDKDKTGAVASTFGGMLGKAVGAIKGRKGQVDE